MKQKEIIPILAFVFLLGACKKNDHHSFELIESFESEYVANRTIQVYLPPSYSKSRESYPVIYMHDGQMLFDSTTTWNGQEWGVDETMNRLIAEGKINEAIVVGISNGGSQLRHPEYFPQNPFERLDTAIQDSLYDLNRSSDHPLFAHPIQSDKYLQFLVYELKPYIDSIYQTQPDRNNTFIMGSSMGGLISMYAMCEYPDIFGGAACLSTHWPGIFTNENNPIPNAFFDYLKENLPSTLNHKWYFDYGTETLDAMYQKHQPVADSIILAKGYTNKNFTTLKFEGAAHNENAWRNRLDHPLTFLLKK